MKKPMKHIKKSQAQTPSHKPAQKAIRPKAPFDRITPGNAEGDLETVEQDLNIQEQRKPNAQPNETR